MTNANKPLRVIGAGIGRTGTHSLKIALEQLLGGPCYHMLEVIQHGHDQTWSDIVDGKPADWDAVFDGYVAAVDWPAAAFWRELADHYPDAIVLLSTRTSADAWFTSANDTIFEATRRTQADPTALGPGAWVIDLISQRFTPEWNDAEQAKAAYEKHNAEVRATIPSERLVDWKPGDGWEPICNALGLVVPDAPFPHVNSTDDFRAMLGLDS